MRKNSKRIFMIHPPFKNLKFGNEWEGTESLIPPLGLMYIASPLLKEGYNVKFLDLNVDRISKEIFLEELKNSEYILISCYSASLHTAKEIIKLVRKVSNAQILCGGPYCRITGNYVQGSDLTVIGEAEEKIVDIIKGLPNKNLKNIPGLIYKENGKIKKTNGILQIENLDNSINSTEILSKGKDYGYLMGFKLKIAGMPTSRGCPFNCTFCTHKKSKESRIVRKRSVESVITELKELQKNGYEYVVFLDDNFLHDKERVNKIMDRIIFENIKLRIIIQGRVDSADLKYYEKLYKAGVITILFGIEYPDQEVLDFYKKGITVNDIKKAIHITKKVGILSLGYFMIGSPIEKKEHFKKLMKFVNESPLDIVYLSILHYMEGSELWDDAVNQGKIKRDQTMVSANENLSNYSYDEWLKMKNELLRSFYFKPSWVLRIVYKLIRLGLILPFIKYLWVVRSSFFEKIKSPYMKERKESIIKVEN